MLRHEIPPFYFPSTVAFIDDSRDFLDNLSLQLDAGLAFRLFDSPVNALVALNGTASRVSVAERLFSISDLSDELPPSHHVLDLKLDTIAREIYNPHRFEQVSVVVADYDMPEIDGLELCRNIKNSSIKKILLTGKADEKIAVKAFNQGLIDRFILKQEADVIPMLNRAITELQLAYFENMARSTMEALSLGSHGFLRDARFAEEFRGICNRLGIVEFYLTAVPEGFLMLDADGKASLLVVKTEKDLRNHFDIAYDQAAPEELLQQLKSGAFVPFFPNPEGEYVPECEDWRSCLYPATEIKGREWYLYAIVTDPPNIHRANIISYNAFLDWLDKQDAA